MIKRVQRDEVGEETGLLASYRTTTLQLDRVDRVEVFPQYLYPIPSRGLG